MKKILGFYLASLSLIFVLTGCVVRTYPLTKDRIDQDLTTGNRGYIKGQAPSTETKERETSRTVQVVEVELRSPIKFEKSSKQKKEQAATTESVEGNRGYLAQSETPEINEANFEKYTVQKNDTLQKISKKFYGTTKKWTKIYEANKNILSAPDKIRPGQVLNIPVEALREPKENLK